MLIFGVFGGHPSISGQPLEMDIANEFSASDWSICPLIWNSNCILGVASSPFKMSELSWKGVHFHRLLDNQWIYHKTDSVNKFSVSIRSVHPLEQRSNHSLGPIVGKFK